MFVFLLSLFDFSSFSRLVILLVCLSGTVVLSFLSLSFNSLDFISTCSAIFLNQTKFIRLNLFDKIYQINISR